jgi:hypothetical protein
MASPQREEETPRQTVFFDKESYHETLSRHKARVQHAREAIRRKDEEESSQRLQQAAFQQFQAATRWEGNRSQQAQSHSSYRLRNQQQEGGPYQQDAAIMEGSHTTSPPNNTSSLVRHIYRGYPREKDELVIQKMVTLVITTVVLLVASAAILFIVGWV